MVGVRLHRFHSANTLSRRVHAAFCPGQRGLGAAAKRFFRISKDKTGEKTFRYRGGERFFGMVAVFFAVQPCFEYKTEPPRRELNVVPQPGPAKGLAGLLLGKLGSRGGEGVVEKHDDGHGADAARDGGDGAGDFGGGGVIDVAAEARVGAVDADVDHDGARLDHLAGDEFGFADGGDEDVRLAANAGQVFRAAMAEGNRCVAGVGAEVTFFGGEERRDGFADDFAAADDDGVFAADADAAAVQNLEAAVGRAGEIARAALDQEADVFGVKTIDVFQRMDGVEDFLLANLGWQRKLNQNTVNLVVIIEVRHQL
jgi:hypothetical protein